MTQSSDAASKETFILRELLRDAIEAKRASDARAAEAEKGIQLLTAHMEKVASQCSVLREEAAADRTVLKGVLKVVVEACAAHTDLYQQHHPQQKSSVASPAKNSFVPSADDVVEEWLCDRGSVSSRVSRSLDLLSQVAQSEASASSHMVQRLKKQVQILERHNVDLKAVVEENERQQERQAEDMVVLRKQIKTLSARPSQVEVEKMRFIVGDLSQAMHSRIDPTVLDLIQRYSSHGGRLSPSSLSSAVSSSVHSPSTFGAVLESLQLLSQQVALVLSQHDLVLRSLVSMSAFGHNRDSGYRPSDWTIDGQPIVPPAADTSATTTRNVECTPADLSAVERNQYRPTQVSNGPSSSFNDIAVLSGLSLSPTSLPSHFQMPDLRHSQLYTICRTVLARFSDLETRDPPHVVTSLRLEIDDLRATMQRTVAQVEDLLQVEEECRALRLQLEESDRSRNDLHKEYMARVESAARLQRELEMTLDRCHTLDDQVNRLLQENASLQLSSSVKSVSVETDVTWDMIRSDADAEIVLRRSMEQELTAQYESSLAEHRTLYAEEVEAHAATRLRLSEEVDCYRGRLEALESELEASQRDVSTLLDHFARMDQLYSDMQAVFGSAVPSALPIHISLPALHSSSDLQDGIHLENASTGGLLDLHGANNVRTIFIDGLQQMHTMLKDAQRDVTETREELDRVRSERHELLSVAEMLRSRQSSLETDIVSVNEQLRETVKKNVELSAQLDVLLLEKATLVQSMNMYADSWREQCTRRLWSLAGLLQGIHSWLAEQAADIELEADSQSLASRMTTLADCLQCACRDIEKEGDVTLFISGIQDAFKLYGQLLSQFMSVINSFKRQPRQAQMTFQTPLPATVEESRVGGKILNSSEETPYSRNVPRDLLIHDMLSSVTALCASFNGGTMNISSQPASSLRVKHASATLGSAMVASPMRISSPIGHAYAQSMRLAQKFVASNVSDANEHVTE
jgi:hypothetical protein